MPQVGNKKFPYTPAGQQQARQFAGSQGRSRPPIPSAGAIKDRLRGGAAPHGQAITPGWGQAAPSPGRGGPLNPAQIASIQAGQRGRGAQGGGGGVDPQLLQKIMQMLAAMQRG